MAMLREPLDALTTGEASIVPPVPDKPTCSVCHARSRLGSLTRCRECIRDAANAQLAAGAEAKARVKAREQAATKRCRACKAEKPLDEFSPHPRAKDGQRNCLQALHPQGLAISKPIGRTHSTEEGSRRGAQPSAPRCEPRSPTGADAILTLGGRA